MKLPTFKISLMLLVIHVALGSGLSTNSNLVIKGICTCTCSATSAKVSSTALKMLRSALQKLNSALNSTQLTSTILSELCSESQGRLTACSHIASMQECIDAEKILRPQYNTSICTYRNDTKVNLKLVNGSYVVASTCFEQNSDTAAALADNRMASNEGCVAIEHLNGYKLQHKRHMSRPVLCYDGFCATPNHGIYVKEKYTSMKEMCSKSGWKCNSQVKLVNNLKIIYNSHAKINKDITISAFDVRFPKTIIFVAQVLEDVLDMCAISTIVISLGYGLACKGIGSTKVQDM